MRFLIIATVIACAACTPLISPYPVLDPLPIAPARPTISAGDINGAAIEAQVELQDAQVQLQDAQVQLTDNLQAQVDAERQLADKASELRDQAAEQQGQVLNQVEENAWRAVDNAKTIEAVLDGAAAREAPVIAKNIVRNSVISGVGPIVPDVKAPAVVSIPRPVYSEPAAYASAPVSYVAAPIKYAPGIPSAYGRVYNYPIEYTQNLAYAF